MPAMPDLASTPANGTSQGTQPSTHAVRNGRQIATGSQRESASSPSYPGKFLLGWLQRFQKGAGAAGGTEEHVQCLGPLIAFYRRNNRPLPPVSWISPEQIPQPHRDLLVHDSDMTSTLENFHGESIHLEVLHTDIKHGVLHREVVLLLDSSNRPVEYGAIEIQLDVFPEPWRTEITAGKRPLGALLNASGIAYTSQPAGFFRLPPDDFLIRALNLPSPSDPVLFGRRNTLRKVEGPVLAEIVEILP